MRMKLRMIWRMMRWLHLQHGPDDPRVPADGLRVTVHCQEVALGAGEVEMRRWRRRRWRRMWRRRCRRGGDGEIEEEEVRRSGCGLRGGVVEEKQCGHPTWYYRGAPRYKVQMLKMPGIATVIPCS